MSRKARLALAALFTVSLITVGASSAFAQSTCGPTCFESDEFYSWGPALGQGAIAGTNLDLVVYETFSASYPTLGTWRTVNYRSGKILRFDDTIGVTVPKETTRIRLVGVHYATPDIEYSLDGGVTWTQVEKDFPGSLDPDTGSPYSIDLNFCPAVEENSEILIRAVNNEFDLLKICVY